LRFEQLLLSLSSADRQMGILRAIVFSTTPRGMQVPHAKLAERSLV